LEIPKGEIPEMTGGGEYPPKQDCSTRKAISRQINVLYLVVAIFATVLLSIFALALWSIEYLTFLLFYDGICLLCWLFARWYILRGRDADAVVKRFNRVFFRYRRGWDQIHRPRAPRRASDFRYTKADAYWVVGGIAALASLLLIILAALLSSLA
jgi:hypothetical protein